MSKTEAEILQIFKDQVKGKKLTISEITMQKRAAKIANRNLEGEDETSAIEDAIDDFVVVSDNIRFERSQQKKETNEEWEKRTQTPPNPPKPQEPDAYEARLKELEARLEKQTKKEKAQENRQLLISKLFEKGAKKEDKDLINEFVDIYQVADDTDIESASERILGLYNKTLRESAGGDAVPPPPKDTKIVERYQSIFKEASK